MTRAMEFSARTAALREIGSLMRAGAFGGKEAIIITDNDEMLPFYRHADNLPVLECLKTTGMNPMCRHS